MLDPITAMILAGGTVGAAGLASQGGGYSQVPTMTDEQTQLLNQMVGTLGQQWGQGITPYQGERVPPISPLQQQAFDIMGGYMPFASEGQDIMSQILKEYPGMAGRFQKMGGEALERAMQPFDPTQVTERFKPVREFATETFMQDLVPQIMERFASQGATRSGALNRTLGREAGRLSMGLSAQMAPYMQQAAEAHAGRQAGAIPQAFVLPTDVLNRVLRGVGQMPMSIMQAGMGAGGIQRGIAGEELGAEQQIYQEGQPWQNPWMQFLPTALGTQPFSYAQKGPNMAAMMMPMFGSLLGGAAMGGMGGYDPAYNFGGARGYDPPIGGPKPIP